MQVVCVLAMSAFVASDGNPQDASQIRGTKPAAKGRSVPRASASGSSAATLVSPVVLPSTRDTAFVIPSASPVPSVVSIAVPASLPAASRVTYTVTPLIEGAVIGKLTGALNPVKAGVPRSILFAARAPRPLPAGEVQLALVRFTTNAAAVEVPIVARVDQARDIRIAPVTSLGVVRAGMSFTLGFRLTNLGNAPDTVSVQVVVPAGWRVHDPESGRPIAISMHGTVDRRVQVISPDNAQGQSTIALVVLAKGLPVAESRVDVQILGGSVVTGSSGPTLTMTAAAASGPWGALAHVETLELSGPLSDDMTIWARASSAPWHQGGSAYALSRANVLLAPPALELSTATWKISAGVHGTSLSELAGVNLVGRGATVAVTQPDWNARAVAASPDVGQRQATGSLLGGRVEATPGRFALSTAVARLRETGNQSRELEAWTLGARVSDVVGGQWAGEVGRRRFDGQTAQGWSTTYSRRTRDDHLDVRYVLAPGGSRAFARTASELVASASRRLGPAVSVTGSYWKSADEGAQSLSGLTMGGWSLGTHATLGDGVMGSLTARRSEFGATTTIGAFGSGEQALDASLEGRSGNLAARVAMTAARLRRVTTVGDGSNDRFVQQAPRVGVRAAVGTGHERGTISLTGQYDRSGAGIGFAPVQWSFGLEVARAIVPGAGDILRLNAAAERIGGIAAGAHQLTLRVGLEADLPLETSLRVSAERNPWIMPEADPGSWMYVVGVSRAVRLPRLSHRATRGQVFRDLNGNDQRDAGEPGFHGVLLRRGAHVAMTDAGGRFSLGGDERQSYEIDARSLPVGWLVPSTVVAPGTHRIGVLSVSPLLVDLALDEADSLSARSVDLAQLVVIARDSAGREWLARRSSRTQAIFDALPPGRYTIEVDATAAREPLRIVGDVPQVSVSDGRKLPPLRIVLRPRALRFSTPRPGRP
ncbi:MAG TPA: hypothetical protein VF981_04990 [Gemmatimonadaceae bacterium]